MGKGAAQGACEGSGFMAMGAGFSMANAMGQSIGLGGVAAGFGAASPGQVHRVATATERGIREEMYNLRSADIGRYEILPQLLFITGSCHLQVH